LDFIPDEAKARNEAPLDLTVGLLCNWPRETYSISFWIRSLEHSVPAIS